MIDSPFVAKIDDHSYNVAIRPSQNKNYMYTIDVNDKTIDLSTNWELGDAIMRAKIEGEEDLTVHVSIVYMYKGQFLIKDTFYKGHLLVKDTS